MSRRKMTVVVLAVFVAVGVLGAFFGSPLERFRRSEASLCQDKCAALNRASRLVPALPPGSVGPGRYDGPWTCECF
jgi:hypothetical protein